MASSRILIASLLLVSLLLLHIAEAQQIDCGAACEVRCTKTKRPNLCKRACGSCCNKCSCVPPGTAGNYEFCPCYGNLTTRKQVRKCP